MPGTVILCPACGQVRPGIAGTCDTCTAATVTVRTWTPAGDVAVLGLVLARGCSLVASVLRRVLP